MKILMLTPYLPYPIYSGGQIRTFNLLKNLAEKHEITLFSFIREKKEKKYINELLKYCKRVEVVKRRKAWSILNVLMAGFSPLPFLISLYYSPRASKKIKNLISKEEFDLIHAECFYVTPIIPKTLIPILLVEQTIEFLVYQHFVETTKYWFLKPFLYLDVFKIKLWEKFYWRKAAKVIAMSRADEKIMKNLVKDLDVSIVPNGVDVEKFDFRISRERKNKEKVVLFVGNFKWLQNKEAALILIEKIWPRIVSKLPEARLWIVGLDPPGEIRKFDGGKIKVDGGVKDIRQAYYGADVLLAPIYGGGGTRYKILEAMACGTPVVTTKVGIEGLAAKNNEQVIIEDTPEELAQSTVGILENRRLRRKIINNARKLVERNYNWQKIADRLDKVYKEVGGGK